MTRNPHMLAGETDADFCRRMGWTAGTCLAGDEGFGETIIQITAVGRRHLLAETISHNGKRPSWASEATWTLTCRAWRQVPAAPQQACA